MPITALEVLNHPYFIRDDQDQGAKITAKCVFHGVHVDEPFVVGPITIRPRDREKDKFPEPTRFDHQSSVLELNYVDTKGGQSMYMEPLRIQEAAFEAVQLLVNSWSGISQGATRAVLRRRDKSPVCSKRRGWDSPDL